jgi:hypothetical protein
MVFFFFIEKLFLPDVTSHAFENSFDLKFLKLSVVVKRGTLYPPRKSQNQKVVCFLLHLFLLGEGRRKGVREGQIPPSPPKNFFILNFFYKSLSCLLLKTPQKDKYFLRRSRFMSHTIFCQKNKLIF